MFVCGYRYMVLKLYMNDFAPGVRAVFMTTAALNLEINEEIYVNLLGHNKDKGQLLKINPACTVPSLDDDGFIVNDSHAIMMYLVDKFGEKDELYPKDLKKRSRVNNVLMFDCGVLFPTLHKLIVKMYALESADVDEEDTECVKYACGVLERMLEDGMYTAGAFLSIGDFCTITTVTSLCHLFPLCSAKYPNITAWIARMQKLPYYHMNQHGLEKHVKLMEEYKTKYNSNDSNVQRK